MVDLRSDTVTRPSPGMRSAIAEAEVGDDVFGDDPTVLRLQAHVAKMFGHEAALFVPSGTMANQIALFCHCRPGDHVIVPDGAHVVHYETGGGAALAGVQFCELGRDGRYDLDVLEDAIQPDDHHHPPTRLITVESTHNASGGRIVALEHLRDVATLAREYDLPLHLDGARIFNAIAAGQSPHEIGTSVTSLGVCLSKGLGAPIGSLIVGSERFVHRAHRYRKMLGGGMRQVGLLAAAGLYALEHNLERLADDHRRARALARGLGEIDHIHVDVDDVETNILYFDLSDDAPVDAPGFVEACRARDVLGYPPGPRTVRWVTHLDIDDEDVTRALAVARTVLSASS